MIFCERVQGCQFLQQRLEIFALLAGPIRNSSSEEKCCKAVIQFSSQSRSEEGAKVRNQHRSFSGLFLLQSAPGKKKASMKCWVGERGRGGNCARSLSHTREARGVGGGGVEYSTSSFSASRLPESCERGATFVIDGEEGGKKAAPNYPFAKARRRKPNQGTNVLFFPYAADLPFRVSLFQVLPLLHRVQQKGEEDSSSSPIPPFCHAGCHFR